MELSKNFDHQTADSKWYQHWLDKQYFKSVPDGREPYTVVIPPPNVTGILHMGHCLNNTIQDVLVRRARMQGKNACWVPGTDHASIATEAKVVQMLRERGIAKSSLSRDEFLSYAWEWKEKYGGIILEQLKKLGCSLDWDRVNFTMDADYSQSVMDVFVDLYKKGLIYRGKRMINWDPKAKTALSDEEVIMRETNSKLYHLKYELVNEDGSPLGETITIATVRPETILGDSAVAVNPNDVRYQHLKGKKAVVPLINRHIPVIFDEYVETDFGTGALKVTPAHDKNDDMLGQKHGLEVIDIMNDDATFSEDAQLYIGMDRFDVRKQIVIDLEAKGYLVKTEDYTNQVGYSERSDAVVEPRLSMQWWVKMEPLATPALKVVMDGEINFHPAKFKNLYQHWMTNIKDWCISRQLWWGHRIPAWYDADGNFYVAANEADAYAQYYAAKGIDAAAQHNNELSQDEDCLDTWFSSWLWPFEVFDGLRHPGNEEVKYYYPTNTLVTAPEIIFFWVARMIMAGLEYEKVIPFKDVYFTGIVRDEQGRKMSKSLGNSPDLLKMIEEYGADAVRFGILISSPAGNDLLFDVKELATVKQGSFFINKIWNAMKLVKMWEGRQSETASETPHFAVSWFENRLAEAATEIDGLMAQFRLSEALKALYTLIWDDFCSWYLEWVKPGFEQPIDKGVYNKTVAFFSQLMTLLHPFLPFATEEVYHQLANRTDDITVKQWTKFEAADTSVLEKAAVLKQVITAIREARAKNQLKPKDSITLHITTENEVLYNDIADILSKQVNADGINFTQEAVAKTIAIAVEKDKFYIESQVELDTTAQRESLQKDLDHQKGFLNTVMKKLSNEKFVANAKPEVVAIEQKKQADAEARIKAIEESLASLG
ncbi:valine--tRNA ligase [Polluticaenibacter yanchengensis]|uniref:Valine--tRNA ligase n=1 Tax=Polluticaenibacter yanchengensis TaxID=3014562 RepID=A0ABT4UPV8_9BACT|nr:valine--tRNA ligase [Chitinophagaceae bacterium LY-5]